MAKGFFAGLLMISVSTPFILLAQQQDTLKINLNEVIVTATKTEKSLDETGRSVTVLTQEQFQNSIYSSVGELLSHQEGIYVVGSGQTPGANQSIFMRGANSNQTAILIDGVRINDVSTVNSMVDLSELSLVNIERIEIIRGSHSTLYGSSAIGGVVNIFTTTNLKEGLGGKLMFQGGSFGESTSDIEGAISAGYKWKEGYFIKGDFNQKVVSGLDATIDTVTDPAQFKNRDQDDWNKFSTGAVGGIDRGKLKAQVAYRYLQMKTDVDDGAYNDDENYTLDFKRNLLSGMVNYKPEENWTFNLSASFTNTSRDALNDSSLTDASGNFDHTFNQSDFSGKSLIAELQSICQTKNTTLTAGYNVTYDEMNQHDYYYSPYYENHSNLDTLAPSNTIHSVFLQGDVNGKLLSDKLNKLNMLIGLRLIENEFFDTKATFEINPSFKLSDRSLLYFSFSTGYNIPSLYQLYAPTKYYTYDNGYTTDLTLGNKSLMPENSESYEIGIRQKLNENFQYNISLFKSVTHNSIEYVNLWDHNIDIDSLGTDFSRDDYRGDRYLNLGKQSAYGIEIEIIGNVSKNMTMQANMNFVSGQASFKAADVDTAQTANNHVQLFSNGAFLSSDVSTSGLTRRPSTANFLISYRVTPKIISSLQFQYVDYRNDVFYDASIKPYGAQSTKAIESYSLLALDVKYQITRIMSMNFKVENMLDESYQEIYGYSTRGRGVYLKLLFSL